MIPVSDETSKAYTSKTVLESLLNAGEAQEVGKALRDGRGELRRRAEHISLMIVSLHPTRKLLGSSQLRENAVTGSASAARNGEDDPFVLSGPVHCHCVSLELVRALGV